MATGRAPLLPGTALGHWRVSEVAEERYDVADAAMAGEMDPAFFLTSERNFVPHEYPCRTRFAAAHRDRRPEVRGAPDMVRNWLPFGSPRLDLSGFWYRPTRVAAWAETVVEAEVAGVARLRLATCGGAVLFVGGREAGFLAPYVRNREANVEIAVAVEAGANRLTVFLDDLAERDTRFHVELDWLDGPAARAGLPFDAPADVVAEVEAALGALHFARPFLDGGGAEIVLPRPLARAGRLSVAGDGFDAVAELAPGTARVAVGAGRPGFRQPRVTLEVGGFAAERTLGLEVAPRRAAAPVDPAARIAEALATVAAEGEPDTVTALARLAVGRGDAATLGMIEAALGPIGDCHDCADFALVPLLWARMRFGEALPAGLREAVDATVLGYRYWLDEPGNDVQWYFSENHALLFHTAAYLAGDLLPEGRFARSGRRGVAQAAAGRERVLGWLDHFERWEMAEFNSGPYFPIDLKGLTALQALAPDAGIRARAGRGIARLVEIVANAAHHGLLTAAQGRSYEHSLRETWSSELSAVVRLLWERGGFGTRFQCLPQLALCLRDHGLALPDLASRAIWRGPGAQEWCFRQGEGGFAALYHYKARAFALGSAAGYRWHQWGYQETLIHARIGTEPQAQIWINHPGEPIHAGFGRPSHWGGSASVPRVQQYRALAIAVFAGRAPQPELTHAWFPQAAFDELRLDPRAAFARSGDGLAAVIADGPLEAPRTGPGAGCELRLAGRRGRWVVRLAEGADLRGFARRFGRLGVTERADGGMIVDDPDYGVVEFRPDGSVAAEGRTLDPAGWTVQGTRTVG